jgi:tripartite-type tricarboxylate transporter receptor subunit TctC
MAEGFGSTIVVDNRGGAGGAVGSEIAAKSPPDGYTLLLGSSSSISINPFLNSKLQYSPNRDFAPITLIGFVPHILLVNPSVPATNVKEFVAYAKGKTVNFGSAGIGTSHHLSGEIFKTMTGVNMTHVPYAGSGPAIVGLMGGHVQFLSLDAPAALPQIKAGKVKALGIATLKRDPLIPDLPTVSEAGLPGFEVTAWYGLFTTSKSPQHAIARLTQASAKALAANDVREGLAKIGVTVHAMNGPEFVKFLGREDVKWAKAVKDSGAKLE